MNKKLNEMRINSSNRAEFYQTHITLHLNAKTEEVKYSDIMLILTSAEKKIVGVFVRNLNGKPRQLRVQFGSQEDLKSFQVFHHSAQPCEFRCKLLNEECELSILNASVRIRFINDPTGRIHDLGKVGLTPKEDNSAVLNFNSDRHDLEFTALEEIDQFKKVISSSEHGESAEHLEDIDKFKIYILENDPHLKKLYQEIVVKGVMTEDAFWECRTEFKEYRKFYFKESQKLGKDASLYITGKISFEDKRKIMKQYPEVAQAYARDVLKNHTPELEKKFWEDFMKLQEDKSTEIVGGKNPVVMKADDTRLGKRKDFHYGEVDIGRNLDLKLNFAEQLAREKN